MILSPDTPNLPPLPRFQGDDAADLTLDVFTRSTMPSELKPGYGDTDRLAELGAHVLRLCVTKYYFRYRPMLPHLSLVAKITEATEGPRIEEWLDVYQLKPRLATPGADRNSVLADAGEMRRFFNVYVGALCYSSGPGAVNRWIFALLDIAEETKVEDLDVDLDSPVQNYSQPPPNYLATDGSAGPSSHAMSLISLALVNQTAIQKGYTIEYSQESQGQPHCPVWTVKCWINGVERGRGTTSKTKTAKDEAARRAFVAMGWHVSSP